jgi:hypothetical protein
MEEIARQAGRQFCPESAEALLDLLREEPVEQSAAAT